MSALAASAAVRAQSVTPGELGQAGRIGEQLLRERELIEEQRQRERERERQRPSGETLPSAPSAPPATAAEGKCVTVSTLELVGARLLPKRQIEEVQRGVVGHCIGVGELDALLKRITNSYVSLGYVTTRAYVPPQETTDGKLTIVIVEGTVERIEVEPTGSVSIGTAFPGLVGSVFNLRAAEQGLDQINRLTSNDAKLDIRPGSTPGSSVLVVLNQPRRRATGSLSSDNTGSEATGEWQGTLYVGADNLLGLNDGFTVSHTRAVDDPAGPAGSYSTYASYSIPYGWWSGTLSYSQSEYDTVVEGLTRSFITSGTSRNASFKVDRVAYRDQRNKLTLYAGLTRRDTENFVAGQLIESSSRVMSVLDLQANLSIVRRETLWSFDAGVSRGVPWLGGIDDPSNLPGSAPRAEFTKLTFGASVAQPFDIFGFDTRFTSTLQGQWSNDVLYPSEQLSLAGPFSVRGYRDVRLYGDRGVTLRNELALPFSLGTALTVRPFIGADVGKLWSHGATPGGYISGWAAGTSLFRGPMSAQLSWSGAGPRSGHLPSDHLFFARFAVGF